MTSCDPAWAVCATARKEGKIPTHWPEVARGKEVQCFVSELGITIMQDVLAMARKRKSLVQLLHDTIADGMEPDIEMDDSPLAVLDSRSNASDERKGWNRAVVALALTACRTRRFC